MAHWPQYKLSVLARDIFKFWHCDEVYTIKYWHDDSVTCLLVFSIYRDKIIPVHPCPILSATSSILSNWINTLISSPPLMPSRKLATGKAASYWNIYSPSLEFVREQTTEWHAFFFSPNTELSSSSLFGFCSPCQQSISVQCLPTAAISRAVFTTEVQEWRM